MLRKVYYPRRNSRISAVTKGNLKERPRARESVAGTAWNVVQAPGRFKDTMVDHGRELSKSEEISPTADALSHASSAVAAGLRRRKAHLLHGVTPSGITKSMSLAQKPTRITPRRGQLLLTHKKPASGRLGKAGKALGIAGMAAGASLAHAYKHASAGYSDRMAELRARESDEAPKMENKTKEAPGSAKPKEKVKKPAKPQAAKNTQTANNAQGTDPNGEPILDPIEARKQHFQQRLSAITMAKNPPARPTAAGAGRATAREAALGFLGGLLEARRIPSEKKLRKEFKSKADTSMRKGTPITHTFYTNDRQHVFRGNPLAMRQKIIAEHRRKQFQLNPGFENYDPIKVGEYFDYLSDRGMLERDRKTLDDSRLRIIGRKTKRVVGRAARKVKGFLSDLVSTNKEEKPTKKVDKKPKVKESGTPFCDFAVGNVKYPHDCNCPDCQGLLESSATSFGQNMRGDAEPNIQEVTDNSRQVVINRLLVRRKKKKSRKVREAYEDSNRNAYIAREMQLHDRIGRGPRDVTQREGTYFGTYKMLRKLDRLGMNVATAALLLNGLLPVARNYKQVFSSDARDAAENVQRVFRGIPVRESSFEAEVNKAGRGYQKTHSRVKEFVDAPWDTVKNAAHAYGIRGAQYVAQKLIDRENSPRLNKLGRSLRTHKYPIGKALGYGGLIGTAYAGKKLVYDPLKKRLSKKGKPSKVQRVAGEISNVAQNVRDTGAAYSYF